MPAVDLVLLWPIGLRIGLWPTVSMLAVAAVVGGLFARAQGIRALREVQQALNQRRSPEVDVISTFLVFVGGRCWLSLVSSATWRVFCCFFLLAGVWWRAASAGGGSERSRPAI